MVVIRTPVRRKNALDRGQQQATSKVDAPAKCTTKAKDASGKLRPSDKPDGRTRHGVYSLAELLKGEIDGRLSIAKKKKELEASLVAFCGGLDSMSPPLLILVERIVFKQLLLSHCEKMILLGQYNPSDKFNLPLANSLRLDLQALETMLRQRKPKPLQSLNEYISETYGDSK